MIMIPSIETCFQLMDHYGMLDHIKAHSVMVAKAARVISRGLEEAGLEISLEKITAGALLHDIGKTPSLNSGMDHEALGREICLQNHLEEIAGIVGQHVRLKADLPRHLYSEEEVVFYADKRVNHDRIVPLQERLDYIVRRYGRDQEWLCRRIRRNFRRCEGLETKLFSKLSFGPGALSGLVQREGLL